MGVKLTICNSSLVGWPLSRKEKRYSFSQLGNNKVGRPPRPATTQTPRYEIFFCQNLWSLYVGRITNYVICCKTNCEKNIKPMCSSIITKSQVIFFTQLILSSSLSGSYFQLIIIYFFHLFNKLHFLHDNIA